MNQDLFDNVGFTHEYRRDMEYFYSPYFDSYENLLDFFCKVFKNDALDMTPRRMMNQIQHFVTLANDIDKIRPSRDPLRILFLKTCLESLTNLSGMNKVAFYAHFPNLISEEGQAYILGNFRLLYFQDIFEGKRFEASHNLTISDFFELVKAVRDMVVHDGNYWEMQFFARDDDSIWLTSIETDEKILRSYSYQSREKYLTDYHFETTLNYDRFIHYFVEACIAFIVEYIDGKEAELHNE